MALSKGDIISASPNFNKAFFGGSWDFYGAFCNKTLANDMK